MDRLKLFAPLLIFLLLATLFFYILRLDDYDPEALPSALLGKAVPEFSLPVLLHDDVQFNQDSIKGEVALLNVWATWCPTCVAEHAYLLELVKDTPITLYGINYKDDDDAAREWLNRLGNPYKAVIVDADGRLGLDLGVYGAPETYLIDAKGIIRYKHVGALNERVWQEKFVPVLASLRSGGQSS